MFYNDHDPPHFHVRYGSRRGRFAIADLSMLDGDLPPRVRGLLVEWAAQHPDERRDDWERSRRHAPLLPIAPLE